MSMTPEEYEQSLAELQQLNAQLEDQLKLEQARYLVLADQFNRVQAHNIRLAEQIEYIEQEEQQ